MKIHALTFILRAGAAIALALTTVACATIDYGPREETVPQAADKGPPVATYQLPDAKRPRGLVHVISFGVEALAGSQGEAVPYLHFRVAAINSSDRAPWLLDPNEQALETPTGRVLPTYSEGSQGGPTVELGVRARGHLDLYFPLPAAAEGSYALAWTVRRGGKPVAGTTPLQRHEGAGYAYLAPAAPEVVASSGVDSWWWNDHYFWCTPGGDRWWSYRRHDFHRRYPHHQPPHIAAAPAPYGTHADSPAPASSEHDEPTRSSWRYSSEPSSSSGGFSSGTSSWRNPPPDPPVQSNQSDSSSSSSPEPPPAPPPPPPSDSGGGGSGKSAWRGGG